MDDLIVGFVFLLLALVGMVLRKTYFSLPLSELKRRARKTGSADAKIYRAAAYGNSLHTLLWLYIGITTALSLILLARVLPVWLGVLIVGPLLWIVFSLLPASRTTKFGWWLTRALTPLIAWLLNFLHPVLSRSADFFETRVVTNPHTGIYERDDLLKLIRDQKSQNDSRITEEELDILERTLQFDQFAVRDILIPRTKVRTILSSDVIGPILINELHNSNQAYALVKDTKSGPFVGSLAFSRLSIKTSGTVQDIMEDNVYYLHEADSLSEALHAFFVTNHPLFIVINNFEEYLGIVTVESMLHRLLGHIPGQDFDLYSDPAAVAARHTKNKNDSETADTTKTDEVVLE